jgi:adhesin transport system membrane fusion protein
VTQFANYLERFRQLDPSRKLILISAVGVLALLLWASLAQIDEVTHGMGKVIPSSKAQVVQAADAAVVKEILVRGGQSVKKGQLLVRLDDAQSSSELGQLQTENQLLKVQAQRLAGEASGNALGCESGSDCAEQRQLQQARMAAASSKQDSLAAAIEQRRRDLSEAQATEASLTNSLQLATKQVAMLKPLADKGIVPQTDLMAAQRDQVDTQGKLAAARQGVARAQAAVQQAQADLDAARFDFRQQALNERSEIATKIAVNQQSIIGAEARKARNELRAPADGIVNDVQVTTEGGFVNAGEMLMQVIPVGEKLLIEARINPKDIAFVKVGDRANVKVTAYDFSTYGGLTGRVEQVSADSIYDEAERQAYYTVVVETQRSYIAHGLQRLPIVPGMICDVEIITGRKSVLSYLTTPLTRGLESSLRER